MMALIVQYLEYFLVAAGAIALMVAGLKRIYSTARSIEEIVQTQRRMEKQLFPNGGGTLRDSMDRIEADNKEIKERTRKLEELVVNRSAHASGNQA
jgi:hypothetical protein